jgi:hypothetical protein
MSEVRCKDCLFAIGGEGYLRCGSDGVGTLVTGEHVENSGWRGSCYLQREDGFWKSLLLHSCGKRGRFFKPKPVPHD